MSAPDVIARAEIMPSERLRILMYAATHDSKIEMNRAGAEMLVAEIDALRRAARSGAGRATFDALADKFAGRYGEALARAALAESVVGGWLGCIVALCLAVLVNDLGQTLIGALMAVLP